MSEHVEASRKPQPCRRARGELCRMNENLQCGQEAVRLMCPCLFTDLSITATDWLTGIPWWSRFARWRSLTGLINRLSGLLKGTMCWGPEGAFYIHFAPGLFLHCGSDITWEMEAELLPEIDANDFHDTDTFLGPERLQHSLAMTADKLTLTDQSAARCVLSPTFTIRRKWWKEWGYGGVLLVPSRTFGPQCITRSSSLKSAGLAIDAKLAL